MNIEQVQAIINNGEGPQTEFKATFRSLIEEVCAFSNAEGGLILIGVSDDGTIIGSLLSNAEKSALADGMEAITPKVEANLSNITIDGKSIWIIEVPEGDKKPYAFGGVIFVRKGANCQKIQDIDTMRMLFQQNRRVMFEDTPCPTLDVDKQAITEFIASCGLSNGTPDFQVLSSIGAFCSSGKPKAAAVLFFDCAPEAQFVQSVIRCILYKGTQGSTILDNKTFGGPLLQQYCKSSQWIQEKLNVRYEMDGLAPRKEIWEIPLEAIKEALLNAICHRDYSTCEMSITVSVFDDRIEIINPGLLSPVVADNFGRFSWARNPLIFNWFCRMHLVEQVGSGIRRMREFMKERGLPEPLFETSGFFCITLFRGKGSQSSMLDTTILDELRKKPEIRYDELEQNLSISSATLSAGIKRLKDGGFIIREGTNRRGLWKVIKD